MSASRSPEQSALERAKERQKLFVQFGIEQFNNGVDVYRTGFFDPKEAKDSKLCQGTGGTAGFVAEGTTEALVKFFLPEKIPLGETIQKVAGKLVGKGTEVATAKLFGWAERSSNKETAQKVYQMLKDCSADNTKWPKWQRYLAETLVQIFNHHHIQFVHLMEHLPEDMPESKLMWKLAQDAVLKMFHALENEKDVEERILEDKDFLIKAFIRGEVESGTIAKLTSKLTMKLIDDHRQLRFLKDGKTIKVTTRDIFTNVNIYCPQNKTFYQAGRSNKEMLWRRRFPTEDVLGDLEQNLDVPNLQKYEEKVPTFNELPDFDETGGYLNHIKLQMTVEKMEEEKEAWRRQLLESIAQDLVSNEELIEELKNFFPSKEDLAKLNIEALVKKVSDLDLKTEKPFTVLMCGETGSGKSTLSTIMTGNKYNKFRVSKDSSKLTTQCENNGKDGHPFLGIEGSGRKIQIIDAPGLGNSQDSKISDDEVVREVQRYLGERTILNDVKISALLWIEDANSFSGSGAEKRVEHYIKRISPEAMKNIIMIFNKDSGVDDDSLAKLTKAFKTALKTAAKKQFAMSDDNLKQSIDNIPCILLEQCEELQIADQVEDAVLEEFIHDNEEQLEKLLKCVKAKTAINSFEVFDDKSKKDQN